MKILLALLLVLALPQMLFADAEALADGFVHPPVSAQPQTWWHWMNGNITKAGITADLEAMHRVGISEANIITVASDIPPGNVPVMSPQFFDMVQYAADEANRLGMTLCMDNCPGWSSSGGPWVSPEHAMQLVTISETAAVGPGPFAGKLAQPATKKDFYRDIAVLAFKTPGGEEDLAADNQPAVTTNLSGVDASPLRAGAEKPVAFPVPNAAHPYYVQLEFPKPITARTLLIRSGTMRSAGGVVLASDDGAAFHEVCPFTIPRSATAPVPTPLSDAGVSARFLRLVFNHTAAGSTGVNLKQISFSGRLMILNLGAKASFEPDAVDPLRVEADSHRPAATGDWVIHRDGIINLTAAMQPDGSLTWNIPAGRWTILRIGYTPTGVTNHPAPPEATGLECDKLSTDGLDASWKGMMQPILDRLGPLAGKVLVHCLIDSYETGGQNWTPKMAAEFQARRGYDPIPYLAVLTGRIVDSPEVSERFLWDMRRTVADLFAQNYYGYFTELCHKHGLQSMIEPYTGPFESLQAGGSNDIPMAEFWAGGNGHASVKMASSVGHIYGQPIIAAESFTGRPEHGMWMEDPYSFKALGDQMFCEGINRYVFHRFTHQPWMDKFPGMTMGQWGINLDRTNTWFELAGPWMQYITHCQYLLQQGRTVADVAYFCGQSAPVLARSGTPALPRGYDFDDINADVLMTRATVVDHRITLPSGARYVVLVLPESDPRMTPQLLGKIRDLVRDGATVLGPRPAHSPSLQDYPACDEQVQKLAQQIWASVDGKTQTENYFGEGKAVSGESLEHVLGALSIAPDFESDAPLRYVHRTLDNADIYFVANHSAQAVHADCTFRLAGKIPEFWHPDTGVIERANTYSVSNNRITVPIDFDPTGSVFVVFRNNDSPADHVAKSSRQLFHDRPVEVRGSWTLNFPPHWGAPPSITLDRLISWPDYPDSGVKYFSGTATYVREIDIPSDLAEPGRMVWLDLGEVKNLAQVKVNGTDLGILWKPPFRVDLTSAVKPGANHIEIAITNLWPNRMIGDEQLPPDVEWKGMKLAGWPQWLLDGKPSPTGRLTFTTWHHITKDMPLLPSGLLGPVTLEGEKWEPTN